MIYISRGVLVNKLEAEGQTLGEIKERLFPGHVQDMEITVRHRESAELLDDDYVPVDGAYLIMGHSPKKWWADDETGGSHG